MHGDKKQGRKETVTNFFSKVCFTVLKTISNKLKSLNFSVIRPGEANETYHYQIYVSKQQKRQTKTNIFEKSANFC